MKRLRSTLLWALLCLLPLTTGAQRPRYEKMSPLLRQLARQQTAVADARADTAAAARAAVGADARRQVAVCAFVKATAPEALSEYGCRQLARAGNVYIAAVPVSRLGAMSLDPRVLRMEARQGNSIATDRLAADINALPVYEGQNLPQAYTGRGVVVGVMDIGFDLTHPNFYSRDTTDYRIRQFWDMLSADTVGSPLYVGRDYVGREALLAVAHARDGEDQTHGTHTTGIAAGSGYNSKYRGMAPDADICLVANAVTSDMVYIDSADYYKYTYATDALGFKYMFDYARREGKPCVLSFSEGSGQDFWGYDRLYYEMLDSLIGPGRIIVSAAGNNGLDKTWFCKPVGVESAGTFLSHNKPSMMFTLKSATDFTLRLVTYGAKNDTTLIATREVMALKDSLLVLPGVTVQAYPSCYVPEETCYDVTLTTLTGEGSIGFSPALSAEVVGEDAEVDFWRVSGSLVTNGLNPLLNAGERVNSIMSPASAPNVVCVGATIHRDSIMNYKGEWKVSKAGLLGQRAAYTAVGPTYDGRIKPDVMAPGSNVVSSYSSYYLEHHPMANDIAWDVEHFDFNGRTYAWNTNSGTSMACPAVAGAIALWLQAKPDLTTDEVMGIIRRTSRRPDPTLAYPNNYYGYGEIDVYRGLLDILGVDKIETVSTRHTPARIVPVDGALNIRLPEPTEVALKLRLYNMSGHLLQVAALNAGQKEFLVPLSHVPQGVYVVQLDGPRAFSGSTLVRF